MDATDSPGNLVQLGQAGGERHPHPPTSTRDGKQQDEGISFRRTGEGKKDDKDLQFRTFFLAFHHFDEEMAVRVLKDAMKSSDGIG